MAAIHQVEATVAAGQLIALRLLSATCLMAPSKALLEGLPHH